ncbi:MAG: hypothetical protein ACREOO_02775 [bacterium]
MKTKSMFFALFLLPVLASAQGVDVPPRHMVDYPTAGLLRRGGFDVQVRFYGESGMMMATNVGISPRFMFGMSFGGTNVLGDQEPNWNSQPGVLVRYQMIGESAGLPAVTLGFESQGYGAYLDSTNRFQNKSPGFYAVASKSYNWISLLNRFDFHGGLNYSLEKGDGDEDINFFFGATVNVNEDVELMFEYDLAFNDSPESDRTIGDGKGWFNSGIRFTVANIVYLEFFLKNLFDNNRTSPLSERAKYTREVKLTYFQFIL